MDRELDERRFAMKIFFTRTGIHIVLLPLIFLAVFYFYPLIKIFILSFRPEGVWDPGNLHKLITTGHYVRILWFTFWQAAVSTLLTLLLALPAAYVFATYDFPGKMVLQSLATVAFVLPTVVVAAAFQALLGPRGFANLWLMKWFALDIPPVQINHTVGFILMAHVFYNYTIILRIVGSAWGHLDPRLSEAAMLLGASRWQAFKTITLPLLKPALFAASLLVFIFCFCSFGVILILGGPRFATIEVEIYRQTIHLFNLPMAAALSLVQILFTFSLMWGYTRLQRRAVLELKPEAVRITQRKPLGIKDCCMVGVNVTAILVFLGAPMLALLMRSFSTENGWSFKFYAHLLMDTTHSVFFIPPIQAVMFSLGFAVITVFIALVLGLPAAKFLTDFKGPITSFLDPFFMLPLSTSAVTLGFGFIIAFDEPPLNLRASPILVPIAHSLVAFPFVVRSILPALHSLPKSLREAAAILGASSWQVWKTLDIPIIGRALVVGAVFAFTVSIGEFGATAFVARPQTPTMPVAIYRFLGQPGTLNYGQAMAMSSLLMMVSAAGFMLIERIKIGPVGEF